MNIWVVPAVKKTTKKARKKKPRIEIDNELCKGCRICIEFCPEGVLELNDQEKAIVAHLENCTACKSCELRCPDIAIEVK